MDLETQVIKAMRIGGQRFCDDAIKMWTTGQYANEPQSQREQMIADWKVVKDKIGEFCNEISRSS